MNELEKQARIKHLVKEIKKALGGSEYSASSLANVLDKKKDEGQTKITPQSLSQKINRGLMPFIEVEEIADILGYDIKWIERN